MVCLEHSNVCFKKTETKGSSNTLLYLVPVFLKQTLYTKQRPDHFYQFDDLLEKFLRADTTFFQTFPKTNNIDLGFHEKD